MRELPEVEIEKQLKIWAVRRVAPEFLAGDTAALTYGEHVIRAGLDTLQLSER